MTNHQIHVTRRDVIHGAAAATAASLLLPGGSAAQDAGEPVQGAFPYNYHIPVRPPFERVWIQPDS